MPLTQKSWNLCPGSGKSLFVNAFRSYSILLGEARASNGNRVQLGRLPGTGDFVICALVGSERLVFAPMLFTL